MIGDNGRTSASIRRARARGITRFSRWRLAAGLASVALAGSGLAACGTSSRLYSQKFFFYEVFRDEAAFAEHQQSAHFKTLIAGQALPKLAKRERTQHRFV